jgi:hypothetical protein
VPACRGYLIDNKYMELLRSEAEDEEARVDAESVRQFWDDNVCAPG